MSCFLENSKKFLDKFEMRVVSLSVDFDVSFNMQEFQKTKIYRQTDDHTVSQIGAIVSQ